jgi:hypothetical protein
LLPAVDVAAFGDESFDVGADFGYAASHVSMSTPSPSQA